MLHRSDAIADVYAMLSRLWLRELDEALLVELQRQPLREAYETLGGVIPESSDLDTLAEEYCRLFIGPRGHLPLLESVWKRGELQSESTDSIQSFAELFGFQGDRNLMMDHLGVQLQIMSQATSLVCRAGDSSETSEAAREFFVRHLGWTDPLFAAVMDRGGSDFYLALTRLTKEFLKLEQETWSAA